MILNFTEFLTEGLTKTHDFDVIKSKEHLFLGKLNINYDIKYFSSNNVVYLTLFDFNRIQNIKSIFDCIESFMINMMGWFPSKMIITNLSGMVNNLDYNLFYLIDNSEFFTQVQIIFESKFDIEIDIPNKIYHLSIVEYEKKILKYGLSPKSKNKLSYHPDRIYVCSSKIGCLSLISHMKFHYNTQRWKNPKSKVDDRWIIFEIDTTNLNLKLYCDPNYIGGYYVLGNIPPNSLRVIDREG